MLSPAVLQHTPKIMPVVKCEAVSKICEDPLRYREHSWSNEAIVVRRAMGLLETAWAADTKTHEGNTPALANNIAISEQVRALMTHVGITPSRSVVDHKSRGRSIKWLRLDAGYLGDLAHHCLTSDGFEQAEGRYLRIRENYQRALTNAERSEQEERNRSQREANERAEKRKADMELAVLLLRYGLTAENDWDDVLTAVSSRDQRIPLALAMRATRLDWSDGPWRVTNALSAFTPTTVNEHQIADDVRECILHWDGDGRVFRDTAWNYDRILSGVDPQLAADALLAVERGADGP